MTEPGRRFVAGGDTGTASRRILVVLGLVAGVLVIAGVGFYLFAQGQLDQRQLDPIDEQQGAPVDRAADEPLYVLVVGNDSREGLTEEEQQRYTTGSIGGNTTDTILLFRIPRTSGEISAVSFPRDLRVTIPGDGPMKINAVRRTGGPEALVEVVENLAGFDVDHYVEVTIPAFVELVETVGPIEVCLDEPLRDRKSGADLEAGCQDLDPVEALAYVRSRQGARGDFQRIERQQQFLGALVDKLTATSTILNPAKAYRVVDQVSDSVVTDDNLTLPGMVELGMKLRDRLEDIATATVPAYSATVGEAAYVVRYVPGVEALFEQFAEGMLERRAELESGEQIEIGIWTNGHNQHAQIVESVLFFAGASPTVVGHGPEAGPSTVVHPDPNGFGTEEADAVAALLGARVVELEDEDEDEFPEDIDVMVTVAEVPAIQPVELE